MALTEGGEFERADGLLSDAAELASGRGERELELRALVERAFGRASTDPAGSREERRGLVTDALRAFEPARDDLALTRALLLSAVDDATAMHCEDAVRKLRRALEHATTAGATRHRSEVLFWLTGGLLYGPVPASEAIAQIEELARDEGGWSHFNGLAGLCAMRGDIDRARGLNAEMMKRLTELGLEVGAAAQCQTIGQIDLLAGDPSSAEQQLGSATKGSALWANAVTYPRLPCCSPKRS